MLVLLYIVVQRLEYFCYDDIGKGVVITSVPGGCASSAVVISADAVVNFIAFLFIVVVDAVLVVVATVKSL